MSDKLRHTNDDSFGTDVLTAAEKPVLVDFWATWCGPCRALEPVLEKNADELSDKMDVYKLNIEESQATAQKFGVTSIPTLLMFKNGEVVDKLIGNPGPKKLREFMDKHC